ncbi:MAG TPA: alanine--glyoxylate aminotransferase family protein [Sedimentibacter sp.]|nr:alanine--glyoxylate aminotransferase family protein [Sedimentibacter sp.]HNZ83366.1 alanine--glyoxylate aminotransferase family protein [Sedimentibacter sp.]HOH68821.1 alanine--glyoxylate aminotransferase family protein [Sedimentibacter sp.]HPW99889.1 alanine--glyoxylate aminotransferase family protein [Sedimentibacter sp.]HQB63119.1 alanine--glyoxylate aminotransferase family protein [Sedimentibacter sp.]
MHKKLFIPGPIEVREDVLNKMATPMIGHRSKDASNLQKNISNNLKKLFFTENEILLSTSSGTGLMEAAVRCCTKERAAIFSIGSFGDRWHEMAVSNGINAELFKSEPGTITRPEMVDEVLSTGKYDLITITHNETSTGVMNPINEISKVIKKYPEVIFCVDAVSSAGGVKIETDKLGIDICITSSQKALGLPPGLSVCTISERAAEKARYVKNRGYYLDLLQLYDTVKKKDYQYPSTPNLSLMFAMDYQLEKIIKEGLENRFSRHLEMAVHTRSWAKKNFALFADEKYASVTLTAVCNTRNISVKGLNEELGKRGYAISNGYGSLKEKTFRIAHMADLTLEDIKDLLFNIDDILSISQPQ